jgi:hypothetical protein
MYLRPNGYASNAGQVSLDSTGALNVSGSATLTGNVNAQGGAFIGSAGSVVLGNLSGAGTVYLRSNSYNSSTGQATLDSAGQFTTSGSIFCSGTVQSSGIFMSAGASWTGATTGAGTMYLRPNGSGSAVGQMTLDSAGSLNLSGSATVTGNFVAQGGTFIGNAGAAVLGNLSGAGTVYLRPNGYVSGTNQAILNTSGALNTVHATTGASGVDSLPGAGCVSVNDGRFFSKISGTGANTHFSVYNNAAATPALVGSITSSGSATAFNTSSDETLKDFIGPYDPQRAIDIIRADPVRDFTWKESGEYAVGWGAQTSYAVSPDLATPAPPTRGEFDSETGAAREVANVPGEPGYHPWGMDQSKRTPYLWAALAAALDQIDALKARVAVLEGASTSTQTRRKR